MCFRTMASLISSMLPSPSVFGRLIWIRPDLMILGILIIVLLAPLNNTTDFTARDKFSISFSNQAFPAVDCQFSTEKYRLHFAGQFPSLIGRVINIHMMCRDRELVLCPRIEKD